MPRDKTTLVRLTGSAPGAIAVFAVAGENARAAVAKISRHPRSGAIRPSEVLRTTIIHPLNAQPVDDGLLVCVAPDHFEIHVHAGPAVADALIKAALAAGCILGDFAAIADSPLVAEVQQTLPRARTLTVAGLLAAQVDAGLALFASQWGAALAGKNPPELWKFQSAVQWVLQRSARLMPLLSSARIVVLGAPNAGKSTLANAVLGRPVAITSEIPGTTRDWVDAETVFSAPSSEPSHPVAVPVTLVDTAGLRETMDTLEQISIERSHHQARHADLILLVLDGSRPITRQDHALLEAYPQALVALNKMDLVADAPSPVRHAVLISALHRRGLDALMHAALQRLDLAAFRDDEAFAFTPRQQELLRAAALAHDHGQANLLLARLTRFA